MASAQVRQAIRQRLLDVFPSLPLFDLLGTVVQPSSLPSTWAAIEYDSSDERIVETGPTHAYAEAGSAHVLVAGAAGIGDMQTYSIADQIARAFSGWTDATSGLYVTGVEILSSMTQDADGRWFVMPVSISWVRRFYH